MPEEYAALNHVVGIFGNAGIGAAQGYMEGQEPSDIALNTAGMMLFNKGWLHDSDPKRNTQRVINQQAANEFIKSKATKNKEFTLNPRPLDITQDPEKMVGGMSDDDLAKALYDLSRYLPEGQDAAHPLAQAAAVELNRRGWTEDKWDQWQAQREQSDRDKTDLTKDPVKMVDHMTDDDLVKVLNDLNQHLPEGQDAEHPLAQAAAVELQRRGWDEDKWNQYSQQREAPFQAPPEPTNPLHPHVAEPEDTHLEDMARWAGESPAAHMAEQGASHAAQAGAPRTAQMGAQIAGESRDMRFVESMRQDMEDRGHLSDVIAEERQKAYERQRDQEAKDRESAYKELQQSLKEKQAAEAKAKAEAEKAKKATQQTPAKPTPKAAPESLEHIVPDDEYLKLLHDRDMAIRSGATIPVLRHLTNLIKEKEDALRKQGSTQVGGQPSGPQSPRPPQTEGVAPRGQGPQAPAQKEEVRTLPKELSGAKPRYSYGAKQFKLTFESDVDKAAYIAAQKNKSNRDAEYVDFVMQATGMTEGQVRQHGQKVKEAIKSMARTSGEEELTIPNQRKPKEAPVVQAPLAPKAEEAAPQPKIVAASFDRDGTTHEGVNHNDARKNAGMTRLVKKKSDREGPAYGFVVEHPDGVPEKVTREEADALAEQNGQKRPDAVVIGNKLHTDNLKEPLTPNTDRDTPYLNDVVDENGDRRWDSKEEFDIDYIQDHYRKGDFEESPKEFLLRKFCNG
jgi:hypothetical protein